MPAWLISALRMIGVGVATGAAFNVGSGFIDIDEARRTSGAGRDGGGPFRQIGGLLGLSGVDGVHPHRRRRRRRALTASDRSDIAFISGILGPKAGKDIAAIIAART